MTRKPEDTDLCFEADESGTESVCLSRSINFDSFHMNAALISDMKPEKNGEKLYFSSTMPDAYKALARNNGFVAEEYTVCTEDSSCRISPDSVKKLYFLQDGVFRILLLAAMLHTTGNSLKEITKKLPAFEVFSKEYPGTADRASVMQRLAKLAKSESRTGQNQQEGIRIVLSNGSVTVIPQKIHGFKIISEAASMEAAKELCEKAEEYLK